jgi:tetratricopeptide (TPR) repeat protein
MPLEVLDTLLFNRVMRSQAMGDTAEVNFFVPKALSIYEQIDPTDPDGLFHFALLNLAGGHYEEALAKAQQGLEEIPDYVLLLAAAAEASIGLGDMEAARGFYAHLLEVYDAELALMRPGYEHHQAIFPVYLEEARAFLGEGG